MLTFEQRIRAKGVINVDKSKGYGQEVCLTIFGHPQGSEGKEKQKMRTRKVSSGLRADLVGSYLPGSQNKMVLTPRLKCKLPTSGAFLPVP